MNAIRCAVLSALVSGLLSFGVSAEQIPGTQLEMHLERANIGGIGRSVVIRRVPVRNQTTGDTKYYDITFKAKGNASGNLTFEAVNQIDVTPRLPSANSLVAGRYADDQGNVYDLAGPSVDAQGGENYSLQLVQAGASNYISELSVNLSSRSFETRFPSLQGRTAGILDAERVGDLTGSYSTAGSVNQNRWDDGIGRYSSYVTANASSQDRLVFQTWRVSGTNGPFVPNKTITLTRQSTP